MSAIDASSGPIAQPGHSNRVTAWPARRASPYPGPASQPIPAGYPQLKTLNEADLRVSSVLPTRLINIAQAS